MIKKSSRDILINIIFIGLGTSAGAFAITAIMIPNGLTCGGFTGIARLVQQYTNIDFSIIYYLLCGIVFLLVTFFLGFKESKKLILLSIIYPSVIWIFEQVDLILLDQKDLMLAAIFSGVMFGIASGLVFWRGFAFGNTDSIAQIIKRKWFPYVDTSRILFIIDGTVILISAFVFDKNIALYALVTQYIAMKLTEAVLYGLATRLVQLNVITSIPDALKAFVIENVQRGVSSIEITGEYTGIRKKQLIIMCSPRESMLVRRFLATNDPHSLVSVIGLNSVWGVGRGFKEIDKEDTI
ncbi:MAG TPA: YitT family protein [Anaerovoracaceae bacterium]|nr:YitT family protein [Anaerovoracaceae bacterium]